MKLKIQQLLLWVWCSVVEFSQYIRLKRRRAILRILQGLIIIYIIPLFPWFATDNNKKKPTNQNKLKKNLNIMIEKESVDAGWIYLYSRNI